MPTPVQKEWFALASKGSTITDKRGGIWTIDDTPLDHVPEGYVTRLVVPPKMKEGAELTLMKTDKGGEEFFDEEMGTILELNDPSVRAKSF